MALYGVGWAPLDELVSRSSQLHVWARDMAINQLEALYHHNPAEGRDVILSIVAIGDRLYDCWAKLQDPLNTLVQPVVVNQIVLANQYAMEVMALQNRLGIV